MCRLRRGPLLTALLVSLLAHFLLLASLGRFWTLAPLPLEFPIEASLEVPEPPPAVQPRPLPAQPPLPPVPAMPPILAAPETGQVSDAMSTPAVLEAVPVLPAVAPAPPAEVVVDSPEPLGTYAPPLRKAVRSMPRQLEIKYAVLVGEDGFVAGEAVYLWHVAQDRYSLVSTLRATGLTALFVHGSIVQVSEGGVGDAGLRPERYWLKRGERRQETAHFLWPQNRLDLGERRGVHELTPQAQDLLSFPFHLAMTTREDEPDFSLGVTNGRRFKQYDFRNLGRTQLDLGGQRLEVLHLQGRRAGEGSLDVWLDPGRSGVPVKVRTLDQQGKTMMLVLERLRETPGD